MSRCARRIAPACAVAGLLIAGSAAIPNSAKAQGSGENATQRMDRMIHSYLLVDQFERRFDQGRNSLYWNAQGWIGGDYNKLWIKTEGEKPDRDPAGRAEVQALWSRPITPFWDFQAGARYDVKPHPQRGYAVLGVQGLAPYFVDVGAAAFVSHKGDVSARLEAEYDLLLTRRLIFEPRIETNLALQQAREIGVGRGVSDVELGGRLRYEIVRKFAPYVGVSWERKLGRTADFVHDEGEQAGALALVLGIRLWF